MRTPKKSFEKLHECKSFSSVLLFGPLIFFDIVGSRRGSSGCRVRSIPADFSLIGRQWRDHRIDVSTRQPGRGIERANLFQIIDRTIDVFKTEILVLVFTPAEGQRQLYLVSLGKKLLGAAQLRHVIMLVGLYAKLDFFDPAAGRSALFCFLALLVHVFAEIENSADRRPGIRRNLDEIHARFFSERDRSVGRHNSDLVPFWTDNTHFSGADALVAARAALPGTTSPIR